jgi:hypothetical protein
LTRPGVFLPSLRIVYSPTRVWETVRAKRPGWLASLAVQVLPFSLLCAVAWPRASTVPLFLAAVVMLALGFFILAPWFGLQRSWDRAVAVASYASTPVLLSWVLLLFPVLVFIPVIALLHCFALCYLGVQQVLECPESEAAMLVAAAWVFSAFGSMLLGGLCSAAGLI